MSNLFKTAKSVILIGKKPKTGGTTFLAKYKEKLELSKCKTFSFSFEEKPFFIFKALLQEHKSTLMKVCETGTDGLVVLLDEVTCLSKQDCESLVSLINLYVFDEVRFICVGYSDVLYEMYDLLLSSDYYFLNRDPEIDHAFILKGDNHETSYLEY